MGAGRVPGRLGERLEECMGLLQVALDLTRIEDAVRIGFAAAVSPAVILEAGTPLIKAEGARAAAILRSLPQDPIVVADTKTFDTGALEVAIAADAGADAATVLALAPDETIVEAVEEAERRGVAVIGDLIGHPDPVEGARRLARLGVHIAQVHVGVDVQRKLGLTASQMPELVSRVAEAFQGPVAVAGGIKPGEAGEMARAGASIVVIGGGITRARDPREAAVEAVRSLRPGCI